MAEYSLDFDFFGLMEVYFYFYFILFYFILFYFILFYFILFYFILFYFILFYFILFYFILFYFILLLLLFFLSCYFFFFSPFLQAGGGDNKKEREANEIKTNLKVPTQQSKNKNQTTHSHFFSLFLLFYQGNNFPLDLSFSLAAKKAYMLAENGDTVYFNLK